VARLGDRLLACPEVAQAQDGVAQRWSDFYRELSSFQQTLHRLKRQVVEFSGDRRRDAVSLALPGLIADSENFERRFDFWEGRLAQLS
jgi:hypothetical protein